MSGWIIGLGSLTFFKDQEKDEIVEQLGEVRYDDLIAGRSSTEATRASRLSMQPSTGRTGIEECDAG